LPLYAALCIVIPIAERSRTLVVENIALRDVHPPNGHEADLSHLFLPRSFRPFPMFLSFFADFLSPYISREASYFIDTMEWTTLTSVNRIACRLLLIFIKPAARVYYETHGLVNSNFISAIVKEKRNAPELAC
jgi:hypothetical protein